MRKKFKNSGPSSTQFANPMSFGIFTSGSFRKNLRLKTWMSSRSASTTSGSICTVEATKLEKGELKTQALLNTFSSVKHETEKCSDFITG